MPATLILSKSLYSQIEQEGVAAFPNECCGVMIGHDDNATGKRIVEKLEPLTNSFEATEQYHRFRLDPLEYIQAEKSASAQGKLILGFYHSHPDHPAKPSEYDRQYAWPFYSYVIVSIMNRKPTAMTSWLLDEATEQFQEQPITME
jgi:proteasome lid subunit RPN8/RPN11